MWVTPKIKHSFLTKIVACLFLISMAAQTHAADQQKEWDKANGFYAQKQYDSAAVYFEQIVKVTDANASLHYNLGNTYYRLNNIGAAILHYEKALHLNPGDTKAKDNLTLAKARVQNPVPEVAPIFFVTWWQSWLHAFSANVWAIITLLVFISVLVLVYFARTKKEAFANSGRWLSLGIVACLLCVCMTYFTYEAATHSGKAVVMKSGNLLDAPKSSSKVISTLPEGTVLDVYVEEGNFINVKLPNGRLGWIANADVSKV